MINLVLKRPAVYVLFLCVSAFTLATTVAWDVFEGMPHLEDEHANLFQAKIFAGGRITVDAPPHVNSFFVPFVINLNGKRFGKYAPGYPLVLSAAALVNQPWLINSLAATLGILGVYLLGRDLFDRDTGLIASALGVLSPMFVLLSGTLLSHPLSLATLTLFAWAFVRARRPSESKRSAFGLLGGVSVGWAMITRPWTALAIASPFAALALFDLMRKRDQVWRPYCSMTIAFMLVFSILPLHNLATTGSPTTNTYTLWSPYDSVGFGPQFGIGGHTLATAIANTQLELNEFGQETLGWPMLGMPLSWLPTALCLVRSPRTKREWGLVMPPLALISAQMAYWSRMTGVFGPRYYFEALPFLWIVAARGLIKLGSATWTRWLAKGALPLMIGWLIIFSFGPKFMAGHGLYGITRKDADAVTGASLHHALVFVHSDYWTGYASLSWLNQPDLSGELILAEDRGAIENNQVISNYPDRVIYYYDRHLAEPLTISRRE